MATPRSTPTHTSWSAAALTKTVRRVQRRALLQTTWIPNLCDSSANSDGFDPQALPPVITIQQRMGKLRKRRTPAIVRWHDFSKLKEPEQYHRSRLMLFAPWRDEEKLAGQHASCTARYQAEAKTISLREARHIYQHDMGEAFEKLVTSGKTSFHGSAHALACAQ